MQVIVAGKSLFISEACVFRLIRQLSVNQFLRVYALYGRNRRVAAAVLIAAAVFVSLGIVRATVFAII